MKSAKWKPETPTAPSNWKEIEKFGVGKTFHESKGFKDGIASECLFNSPKGIFNYEFDISFQVFWIQFF